MGSSYINGAVAAIAILALLQEPCGGQQRRARVGGAGSQAVEFDCPEEFGYYPHPSDCTQYYVCVFGGALLESCTGGLMYSHELQTCDWPRNVGCGAEGESATISTVRVIDPRTRQTTPTGGTPTRTVSISREQQQQHQQRDHREQHREQQQRQQQEELAKHQLYAEDLGPAEEVESDRQQRVYRGQPSTIGQVARDRDGLRHQVTNAIPAAPGRVASGEKIGVISFGTAVQQQQQQQQPPQQYSFDELTLDDNLLLTNETRHKRRERRQVRFRFPGQGGPALPIGRPGLNTFSLPVQGNAANYNKYQYNNHPSQVPIPPAAPRPSNPAPPPSSDSNYRPIPNVNIPNPDLRHFHSPENYHSSGPRPPPNIPFGQSNNEFKPRPPQSPNPAASAFNLQQFLNQPPASSVDLHQQQQFSLNLQHPQQTLAHPSLNLQQQTLSHPSLQQQQQTLAHPSLQQQQQTLSHPSPNLQQHSLPQHQNNIGQHQYINSVGDGPISFTNFQQTSELFPPAPPTYVSNTNHQQPQSPSPTTPRNPSSPGIIYHQNANLHDEENYAYLLFDNPKPVPQQSHFFHSSTESPSSVPNYSTTLRTLPAGQNSLGFPHDTLSFDEVHKHEQRETSHLVPPPPPFNNQQTEASVHYKKGEVQKTWQELLREQQGYQEDWSPLPHSTDPLPPASEYIEHANAHHPASFSTHVQSTRPPPTQTEGPFRPSTNPYNVGVVYKDGQRETPERPRLNPDLYTKQPSSPVPNYNNKHQNQPYPSPPPRQQAQTSKLHETHNTPSPITVEPNGNSGHQPFAVQHREVEHPSKQTSFPYREYESVKLPQQPNNEKHRFARPPDFPDDVYAEYDDKSYYDDVLLIDDGNYKVEKPKPSGKSEQNNGEQYNRGIPQVDSKFRDDRKQQYYSTERTPQFQDKPPQSQESSELRYKQNHESQRLPTGERPYVIESNDRRRPASTKEIYTTSVRPETSTKDRYPAPPRDSQNKYQNQPNPFSGDNFNFDDYLDKLRDRPNTSSTTAKETENRAQANIQNENEFVRSTTHENVISTETLTTSTPVTTTTVRTRPRMRLRQRPLKRRPIRINTTEHYSSTTGAENTQVHKTDDDNLTNRHSQSAPKSADSTTTTPDLRPVNPNPLTVPFYTGEDGNYYVNPAHASANAGASGIKNSNIEPQVGEYYKYSIDEAAEQTERSPRIISTSESHRYSNNKETFSNPRNKYSIDEATEQTERSPRIISPSNSNHKETFSNSRNIASNHRPLDSTATASYSISSTDVNTHNPLQETVTQRGFVRSKPFQKTQNSYTIKSHDHLEAGDLEAEIITGPPIEFRQKVKLTLPIEQKPHPFSTASSINNYKYQDAFTSASPPKQEVKPKKSFQANHQSAFQENDTIKPTKEANNERIPSAPTSSTTNIPSTTPEESITTSSTQYSNNNWQPTTPYSKGSRHNYEFTTQIQQFVANSGPDVEITTVPGKWINSDYTTPITVYTTNAYTTTPNAFSTPQTSTRPSNELLESIYDIAKSIFKPEYDEGVSEVAYIEPSSESVPLDVATESILHFQNLTTTPHTVRTKLRRRRPKTTTPSTVVHHVAEYPTTGYDLNDNTTPETYTVRRRPNVPIRYRTRRPNTIPITSTSADDIISTSSAPDDLDSMLNATEKTTSPAHSRPHVTVRRRRPIKTKVDFTTTEVYADSDKSESLDRPLQDNVNKENTKPLAENESSTTTISRVEPTVAPVTFIQQQQPAANPNVYNNSQRYDPTQYDPYYNLYDEDVELYRDVADYSQFPSGQGSRQTANNQQSQYRGQSPYKQPPLPPPQEPERNTAYVQPTYNNQQDVYVQNIDPQEYNGNYNTASDDQSQYNQPRQPAKTRTTPSQPEALSTSSSTIRTVSIRLPSADSTPPPRSETQKSRRITLTAAFSLNDNLSNSSRSRSRGVPQRISIEPPTDRKKSEIISLGALLSGSSTTARQETIPSRSHNSNVRRNTTSSFTVIDNTDSSRRASQLDAELRDLQNSFRQNSPQRQEESDYSASRTSTRAQNQQNSSQRPEESDYSASRTSTRAQYQQNSPQRHEESDYSASRTSTRAQNPPQRPEESDYSASRTSTRAQNQQNSPQRPEESDYSASRTSTRAQYQQNSPQRHEESEYFASRTSSRAQNQNQIEKEAPLRSRATADRGQSIRNDADTPQVASVELVSSPSIRIASPSRSRDISKDPSPTRSSYLEADDVHTGVSRNSVFPQTEATLNRGRLRGSNPRKPSSCADAIDGDSELGCSEKPQIRVRPTTATPDSQSTPAPARGNNAGRTRGNAQYTTASGAEPPVNRGTPASVSRSRPTLKPSTAIVSKAQEFVDIYRYPPRRPDPVYPTPQVDKTAAKCRKDVCLLPDCSCGGKEIPGDLPAEEVPQIVLLTFDDAINDLNKGLYEDLFEKDRKNPNGCPISATYYVSHEWTDYSQVQNLYADGHEMASHSVSHSFGEQFSQKKWTKEIAGQREILSAYGGVRLEDIRGMRAPFLAIGGNKMFKMLYDSNFTYDSSMPVYENRPPSWPYTLDYKIFHDCMIPPCPTRSYPGVWEVPMVMWQDLNGGRCSMGDACSNPPTADGVYKMLIKNFERHYTTNRAPFGLFYHAAWFTQPHHKEGFIAFLDTIVNMQDVWLVTNWQAIQWVRDPTPLSRINNFPPFQCNYPERPRRCNNPKVCNLWHKSGVRYMRTCQPCPEVYPWTGKTGVRSSRVDNEIVEES